MAATTTTTTTLPPGRSQDGEREGKKMWTTLLTNRNYFGGALVLHHTLRKHGSRYPLKIMVTREVAADGEYMAAFAAAGIETIVVDPIEPAPREGVVMRKGTWEKLAPWGMVEYEVCVLLFFFLCLSLFW